MAGGNRTLDQELQLDASLIKTVLILGTTLFVAFILGVGLSF